MLLVWLWECFLRVLRAFEEAVEPPGDGGAASEDALVRPRLGSLMLGNMVQGCVFRFVTEVGCERRC